jgi:hypothetical protein
MQQIKNERKNRLKLNTVRGLPVKTERKRQVIITPRTSPFSVFRKLRLALLTKVLPLTL